MRILDIHKSKGMDPFSDIKHWPNYSYTRDLSMFMNAEYLDSK